MGISKNKIAAIRLLHQKKFRIQSKRFIVEGTKSVLELLHSHYRVDEIFCLQSWYDEHVEQLGAVTCTIINEKELERISCLTTPQSVLSIAETITFGMDDIDTDKSVLVLDDIKDPGNLGTIIRSADWFGIKQIVCSLDTVEFTNPKVIQASMGSFSRVSVIYTSLDAYIMSQKGIKKIYGTFMSGTPVHKVHFTPDALLIIGNESNGISEKIAELIDEKIHIPTFSTQPSETESLNASIATAILLYQFKASIN